MRHPTLHAMVIAMAIAPLASAALARDVYECRFPLSSSNMGFVPELVVVSPDPATGSATVADAIIQSEKKGPIEVPIAEDNASKLAMSWTIMLQTVNNDYVKTHYRLAILKAGLKASLTARPLGFSNIWTAQGKCSRAQG